METKLNYQELINKVKKEGTYKEFYSNGYLCIIKRPHGELGHLCGYVGVPENHPYLNHKGYRLSVHGGITFGPANKVFEHDELFFYGFDCAHAGDLMPESVTLLADMYGGVEGYLQKHNYDTYKDMEYVERECIKLATQLKKLELLCVKCKRTIQGDSKYHQVYESGKIKGVRHRKCLV